MRSVLLTAALVAASAVPAAATECLGVVFSSAEEGVANAFSAAVTSDLVVAVDLTAPVGEHVLELRLITPRGHLYQAIAVPIADAGARAPAARRIPGYPRAVAVATAAPREDSRGIAAARIEVRFPIAGSSIVSSSLYGTWSAEIHLDGADAACAAAAFDLRREPWIFDDGLERGSTARWSEEAP